MPDAAAALYRPDCVFRSAPFRDPEPPIEYTRRVFPEARAEDVRFGEPVEAGDRAAVEWWATLVGPDGTEETLAGCSMLRFDDEGPGGRGARLLARRARPPDPAAGLGPLS